MPETYYYATGSEVTSIANAIRTKGGTNQQLEFPDDFVEAIDNLEAVPDLTSITINASNEVQHFAKGNVLVGKYYYADDAFFDGNSDLTKMVEVHAGDTCYVTGSLCCVKAGAEVSGSRKDMSGTFIWQDGTNVYTKNGYTLTFTTTSLSITKTSWNGQVYALNNNPDGYHIIGLRKVMNDTEHDGWNDITVNPASLTTLQISPHKASFTDTIKHIAGYTLIDYVRVAGQSIPNNTFSVDLSGIHDGDTCYVKGILCSSESSGIMYDIQDMEGSFTWSSNNVYTKGLYTLTITASSVHFSKTGGDPNRFYGGDNATFGYRTIGFALANGYNGYSIVTVNPIPSNYNDTSSATATSDDIVSGKTAYGASGGMMGTLHIQHYYTGSTTPSSSLGSNGDIYLKT